MTQEILGEGPHHSNNLMALVFGFCSRNIQNLQESIIDVAARGELGNIRNVGEHIENSIIGEMGRKAGQ